MRAILAISLLAACGSERSGMMTAPDASAAGEKCNGVDDTGDGAVDEGCPCSGFDLETTGDLRRAQLVWIGGGYLTVAEDRAGVMRIASITADGVRGATWDVGPILFTTFQMTYHHVAWSGSTLAVLRLTPASTMELSVFDRDGALLNSRVLPERPLFYQLAWAGDRFVLAGKADSMAGVVFSEYAVDGTALGTFEVAYFHTLVDIDGFAASPATYVVTGGGGSVTPTALISVDRASRMEQVHALPLYRAGDPARALAHSDGTFAIAQPGGELVGDTLQLLDLHGAPTAIPGALVWQSKLVALAATSDGFAAAAIIGRSDYSFDYLTLRLDHRGLPLEVPVRHAAPGASTLSGATLATAAAHGRLAFAHGYGSKLRVIERCE